MSTKLDIDPRVKPAVEPIAVDHETMAAMLQVSRPTLLKWREAGQIPFATFGGTIRYPVRAVTDAVNAMAKMEVKAS